MTTSSTPIAGEARRRRNRKRRTRLRGKTYSARALRQANRVDAIRERAAIRVLLKIDRPTHRDQCRAQGLGAPGVPCPWVGCPRHLYLDVKANGSLHLTFPDLEPWELVETCSSASAERGALTLEEVGMRMNLTRERVRQIEVEALATARANGAPNPHEVVAEVLDDGDPAPRSSSTSDDYDD